MAHSTVSQRVVGDVALTSSSCLRTTKLFSASEASPPSAASGSASPSTLASAAGATQPAKAHGWQ
ncbi:MAG: hypothetical protein ACXWQR_09325 [Ktedonobacterales bacterium]